MSEKFGERDAAEQAQKYAGKINENSVSDLVDKEDKIKGLFEKAGALKKYWDDVCEVFSLIKDRFNGTYTDTPWPTIASLAGALLYVFSPIDCIPDFIPIAGFIDDASVFGFVIMAASTDLMKYRSWKSRKECLPPPPMAIEAKDIKVGATMEAEVIEGVDATEQNKCAEIINAVASHYDVTKDQILSFDRLTSAATARQVAMYIMRVQKCEPISSVAKVFKRNSTTVRYAVITIKKRLESEPEFRKEMEEITSMIK